MSFVRIALGAIGFLFVFGAFAAAAVQSKDAYCLAPSDNVIVYVDTTTPYDDVDKSALVDGISRLFESLVGGERFSLRTISDSFPNSRMLVDSCIPVCQDPSFLGDLLGPCTEGVVINDRKILRHAIVAQLKSLLTGFAPKEHSEILRTVVYSSPIDLRADKRNRMFIFSDMIENSEYISGKTFFSKPNAQLLNRVRRDHLLPDLKGVAVRVFGVGRRGTKERHPLSQAMLLKLTDFWETFFSMSGATISIQPSLGKID